MVLSSSDIRPALCNTYFKIFNLFHSLAHLRSNYMFVNRYLSLNFYVADGVKSTSRGIGTLLPPYILLGLHMGWPPMGVSGVWNGDGCSRSICGISGELQESCTLLSFSPRPSSKRLAKQEAACSTASCLYLLVHTSIHC